MIDEGPSEDDLARLNCCPECGAEVWEDAPICPNCRAWITDEPHGTHSRDSVQSWFRRRQIVLIAIVLAILMVLVFTGLLNIL